MPMPEKCSTPAETFLELGVEADGLDRGRLDTEAGTAPLAASVDDLVDVVAGVGGVGEILDELVGDRRSGLRVAVGALGHGSRSLR